MSSLETIFFLTGIYSCLSVISFSFYFGHYGLQLYRHHGLKLLNDFSLIVVTTFTWHHSIVISIAGLLFLAFGIALAPSDFYNTYLKSKLSWNKKTKAFSALLFIISLVSGYVLNFEKVVLFWSYLVMPIHLAYITLNGILRQFSIAKKSSSLIVAWGYEFIFMSLIWITVVFYEFSNYELIFLISALLHTLFLGLTLIKGVSKHLAVQKTNRIKNADLKTQNLLKIEQNIALERKLSLTTYESELSSLDLSFLSTVTNRIKERMMKDTYASTVLLTRLAKHMRNHVQFKTTIYSSLKDEEKYLSDFKNLCDEMFGLQFFTYQITPSETLSNYKIKSHLLFPLAKNMVTHVQKTNPSFKVRFDAQLSEMFIEVNVLVMNEEEILLKQSELGIDSIQAILIQSEIDDHSINFDKKRGVSLKVPLVKELN